MRVSANLDGNQVVDESSLHSIMAIENHKIAATCSFQYHRQWQSMHNYERNLYVFGCPSDDSAKSR